MKEVARLEGLEPRSKPIFIIVSKFDNGAILYTRPDPKNPHFMVRPDWSRTLMPVSFTSPLTTEYWDDDGGSEFAEMYARLEREGMVLEMPEVASPR